MESIAAIIGERGEVELPLSVLEQLGLHPNDRVEILVEGDALRIVPASRLPVQPEAARRERAARRRAVLSSISRAFAHETVEEADAAVAAALAEVRAESWE